MRMRYSEGLQERMVAQLVGPDRISTYELGRKEGIPESTLRGWRDKALKNSDKENPVTKKKPQAWTPREKMRVVLTVEAMEEEEVGAFLRQEGVHQAQLEQWKEAMMEGLEESPKKRRSLRKQAQKERRRIKELEQELARKEKALSEAAALLLLKKKIREIWADEDDDTASKSES